MPSKPFKQLNEKHQRALREFDAICQEIVQQISDKHPTSKATQLGRGMGVTITCEDATLEVSKFQQISTTDLPFSVRAESRISVHFETLKQGMWKGMEHSLWYCDKDEENRFDWWELGFRNQTLHSNAIEVYPIGASPNEARPVLRNVTDKLALTSDFQSLAPQLRRETCEIWLERFNAFVNGHRTPPVERPDIGPWSTWRGKRGTATLN